MDEAQQPPNLFLNGSSLSLTFTDADGNFEPPLRHAATEHGLVDEMVLASQAVSNKWLRKLGLFLICSGSWFESGKCVMNFCMRVQLLN